MCRINDNEENLLFSLICLELVKCDVWTGPKIFSDTFNAFIRRQLHNSNWDLNFQVFSALLCFVHNTSATVSRISDSILGSKSWLVLQKIPALEQSNTLQGYLLLIDFNTSFDATLN